MLMNIIGMINNIIQFMHCAFNRYVYQHMHINVIKL